MYAALKQLQHQHQHQHQRLHQQLQLRPPLRPHLVGLVAVVDLLLELSIAVTEALFRSGLLKCSTTLALINVTLFTVLGLRLSLALVSAVAVAEELQHLQLLQLQQLHPHQPQHLADVKTLVHLEHLVAKTVERFASSSQRVTLLQRRLI